MHNYDSQVFISDNCSLELNQNNYDRFVFYQSVSGIGFNKLGNYQNCLSYPSSAYFIIKGISTNQEIFQFYNGICFTSTCNTNDLKYLINSIQSIVQIPLQIQQITNTNEITIPINFSNWILFTIIGLLILIILISTIWNYIKKYKNPYKNNNLQKYHYFRNQNNEHVITQCFNFRNILNFITYHQQHQKYKIIKSIQIISLIGMLFWHMIIIILQSPLSTIPNIFPMYIFLPLIYSSDIWFFTTGFLQGIKFLKFQSKNRNIKYCIIYLIQNLIKIWIIHLLGTLICWNILPFLSKGPIWNLSCFQIQQKCLNNLWKSVLMIENLFLRSNCPYQLWIWSVQFQLMLFIIPCLLFYMRNLQSKKRYIFFIIQFITILLGIYLNCYKNSSNNLNYYVLQKNTSNEIIWPLTKSLPFILGINLSIRYYFFIKTQIKKQLFDYKVMKFQKIRIFMTCLFISFLLTSIYLFKKIQHQIIDEINFIILIIIETLFPIFFTLLVLPEIYGFHSALRLILLSKILIWLNLLTNSAYMIHFMVEFVIVYSCQTDFNINLISIIFLSICSIVIIFKISFLIFVIIEYPIMMAYSIGTKNKDIFLQ